MRLLVLDCDSTLSAIEGVDELARLRGNDCFAQSAALTDAAMNGELAVEEVFGKRLELIQPSAQMVAQVAQFYIEHMASEAKHVVTQLCQAGWTPLILSGGFQQAIWPLAQALGIHRVEAVKLVFEQSGEYVDYDRAYPTTRSGGKPELILQLKKELPAEKVVMIGDGISDLETQDFVDAFIACSVFVERQAVCQQADYVMNNFAQLPALLERITCD